MFALNLNSQISALTALTQQKTGGNEDQSAKIAGQAQSFITEFEEKSADGGSTEHLGKKAAQWANNAIEDIAKGAPAEASTESVFAALTAGTEKDGASLDVVGQLSVISDINADQIFGDEALAGKLADRANEFLTKIDDKIADGKSTAKVEKAAADWIAEAVEDIAVELAAMADAEDVSAAVAKAPAGADAVAAAGAPAAGVPTPAATVATPAETRGSSAKAEKASAEKDKPGSAEAQKNGSAASGASASNASDAPRGSKASNAFDKTDARTTGVDASGKATTRAASKASAAESLAGEAVSTPAKEVADAGAGETTNERLEAMKRALAKLSAISSDETASQLSSLVKSADAQDDASGADALKARSATMSDGGQQNFLAAAAAYSLARSGWVAQ